MITSFINIRNVGIKTIIMFLGLLLISSQLYPFIMKGFLLTDKSVEWDYTKWVLLLVGFFLAVGAARYNTMLDAILSKFQNGKIS